MNLGKKANAPIETSSRVLPPLVIADIRLDRQMRRAFRAEHPLRLRPIELKLFETLMASPGQAFTREELLSLVWGGGDLDARTVDVTIGRVRKAVTRGWLPDPILCVRFEGYMFHPDFEAACRKKQPPKKLKLS